MRSQHVIARQGKRGVEVLMRERVSQERQEQAKTRQRADASKIKQKSKHKGLYSDLVALSCEQQRRLVDQTAHRLERRLQLREIVLCIAFDDKRSES